MRYEDIQYYIYNQQLPCEAMNPRMAATWEWLHIIGLPYNEYWIQHLTLIIEIDRANELFF